MIPRSVRMLIPLVGAVSLGCAAPPSTPPQPGVDARFQAQLLEIAQTYESYGRMDPAARVAPTFCAPAFRDEPPQAKFSASTDGATHGLKLYTLFVKDMPTETFLPGEDYTISKQQPVGQVIVKEAWAAEEVPDTGKPLEPVIRDTKVARKGKDGTVEMVPITDRFIPYARKDGKLYHAAEKASLFIMMKVDPATPGTDQGWVYATVSPDRKTVTGAGLIGSCMECHQNAPHDRLFGTKPAARD